MWIAPWMRPVPSAVGRMGDGGLSGMAYCVSFSSFFSSFMARIGSRGDTRHAAAAAYPEEPERLVPAEEAG